MHADLAVRSLAALAHEARLGLFKLLVEVGPDGLAAGAIAQALGVAPSALTFHLKELKQAGLVLQRPDGRRIHYSANFGSMNALIAHLSENCCTGPTCEATGVALAAVDGTLRRFTSDVSLLHQKGD